MTATMPTATMPTATMPTTTMPAGGVPAGGVPAGVAAVEAVSAGVLVAVVGAGHLVAALVVRDAGSVILIGARAVRCRVSPDRGRGVAQVVVGWFPRLAVPRVGTVFAGSHWLALRGTGGRQQQADAL
ncbi:MAG TPA: hypothetical protein VGH89_27850, partial [Pseudonocardia sp.]